MLKMAWVEKKKMAGGYKFKVLIKNDQGKKEVIL